MTFSPCERGFSGDLKPDSYPPNYNRNPAAFAHRALDPAATDVATPPLASHNSRA